MERQILFRGKTKQGEWVYWNEFGLINFDLTDIEISLYAHLLNDELISETVGQYTGLTDKNGKKIFEGDIVNVNGVATAEIIYNEEEACFAFDYGSNGRPLIVDLVEELSIEVIGNIHKN